MDENEDAKLFLNDAGKTVEETVERVHGFAENYASASPASASTMCSCSTTRLSTAALEVLTFQSRSMA
jgi:hypothetical protein